MVNFAAIGGIRIKCPAEEEVKGGGPDTPENEEGEEGGRGGVPSPPRMMYFLCLSLSFLSIRICICI